MNIYYCDGCSKRLAAEESARVVPGTSDKDILCPACLATRLAKPASSARNTVNISEVAAPIAPAAQSPHRRPTSGPQTRPSLQRPASAIQPRVPAQMQAGARASSASRNAVQDRTPAEPAPKSRTPVIFGIVAAVIVLGGIGFMALGGNKNQKVVQKPETPSSAPKVETPVQNPPPAKPTAAPANPVTRVREGKIKPPEPPPPMPEKLPEPDDTWKPLFNGKDIKGWVFWKGAWTVEDGIIVGRAEANKGANLLTEDESFGDFDYACSVYVEGTRYGEVWVRGGMLLPMNFQQPEWKTIRVSARGKNIKATINGQPVTPESIDGLTGPLSFFVSQPAGVMKIKDIKVKTYGK